MTRSPKNEQFIIQYTKEYICDTHRPLSCKRLVFVSIIGLFQTYDQCPPYLLYSALLLMPLKKEWIYSPSKFKDNLRAVSSGLLQNDAKGRRFIELLQWKDSQELVLFANDEYEALESDHIFHPFWQFVSSTLLSLYDPITGKHYKALLPNAVDETAFWKTQLPKKSTRYNTLTATNILSELYFKLLKFERMKVIFNASNPESLNVITSYNLNVHIHEDGKQIKMNSNSDDSEGDKTNDGEWWISPYY